MICLAVSGDRVPELQKLDLGEIYLWVLRLHIPAS